MPRVGTQPHTQEEYEEWLGRLEEEAPLPEDYETFQAVLRGQLKWHDVTYDFNETQAEALWAVKEQETGIYEPAGINPVIVHYPWGTELRYGIQGLQGLFGWAKVQTLLKEEEWTQ